MRRTTHTYPLGRHRAFTTLEMLLALAVTVMIGMAVAMVLTAVGRGLTSASDARSALQRAHAGHARLRAYTDAALAFLSESPDKGFALWLHDDRPDGKVNLTELRVFWFDAQTRLLTVELISFPEEWTPEQVEAADVALPQLTDYFKVMQQQRALGYTTTEVIADGVASVDLDWQTTILIEANRVQLKLGLQLNEEETEPVLFSLALANHREPTF